MPVEIPRQSERTVARKLLNRNLLKSNISSDMRYVVNETVGTAKSGGLPVKLTQVEHRVLELVTQGDSNKEIASAMGISPATVKRHIENLLKKLNLRNRVEAAVYGAMIGGCPAPKRSIRALELPRAK